MERTLFMGAAIAFFFQIWWIKVAAVALLALGVALQTRMREAKFVTASVKAGE
jgi:predicted secreted protein